MNDQQRQLISLAEKLYEGSMSYEVAMEELKKYSSFTGKVADNIHFLYHFVADCEIREKDKEYSDLQHQWLRETIADLKLLFADEVVALKKIK